jgi:hypothetical protein
VSGSKDVYQQGVRRDPPIDLSMLAQSVLANMIGVLAYKYGPFTSLIPNCDEAFQLEHPLIIVCTVCLAGPNHIFGC